MSPTSTRLVTITTAERPGRDRPSEDRIFTTPNVVIVLDGASQPDPSHYDGGWIADTLGRELQQQMTTRTDDLAAILADAIETVADRHQLVSRAGPSTTVSIVRWDKHHADVLVLGDSPVIALTVDGTIRQLRDDRLRHVAKTERHQLHTGQSQTTNGRRDLWRSLVNAERNHRNRPGGYWIAEATPEAAHHARRTRWDRTDLVAILAMTDGVSAGPDRYGIPATWADAFTLARQNPARLVDLVHDTEATDPDRTRWPRSKHHDDKALAVIEFPRQ